MPEITGRTRIFGILADPIDHVRTPQGLNALAASRGYDGVTVPFHVSPSGLPALVVGFRGMKNLGGFIVTVPHKTTIAPLIDTVSEVARLVGAVNVVRRDPDGRLHGELFDGVGFVAGLRAGGHEPRGRSVYIAGAGGAAAAIAFALAKAGIARLTVFNRSQERGETLLSRLRSLYPDLPMRLGTRDPCGHDMAVNATSQGLSTNDTMPFDVETLTANQLVAEIIMQPELTALMAAAAARGCQVHPGYPMLQCQLGLMANWMGMGDGRA